VWERSSTIKREADKVAQELEHQLREDLRKTGEFGRVHILPHSGGDVPDDYDARLVVLAPEQAYSRDKDSAAEQAATPCPPRTGGRTVTCAPLRRCPALLNYVVKSRVF